MESNFPPKLLAPKTVLTSPLFADKKCEAAVVALEYAKVICSFEWFCFANGGVDKKDWPKHLGRGQGLRFFSGPLVQQKP